MENSGLRAWSVSPRMDKWVVKWQDVNIWAQQKEDLSKIHQEKGRDVEAQELVCYAKLMQMSESDEEFIKNLTVLRNWK